MGSSCERNIIFRNFAKKNLKIRKVCLFLDSHLQTEAGRELMLLMEREVRAGTRFKMEEHGPVNDVQSNEQSDKDNLDILLVYFLHLIMYW